jgi:hypothetical protein
MCQKIIHKNHNSRKQFILEMLSCLEKAKTYLNMLFSDEAIFHVVCA